MIPQDPGGGVPKTFSGYLWSENGLHNSTKTFIVFSTVILSKVWSFPESISDTISFSWLLECVLIYSCIFPTFSKVAGLGYECAFLEVNSVFSMSAYCVLMTHLWLYLLWFTYLWGWIFFAYIVQPKHITTDWKKKQALWQSSCLFNQTFKRFTEM